MEPTGRADGNTPSIAQVTSKDCEYPGWDERTPQSKTTMSKTFEKKEIVRVALVIAP